MDITAIFKAVLTPDKDRSAENYAPFKPGDKVVGTVLRLEADGRALIDLGRFRALAQTTMPVQVGQKLPLKVIQTGTPTHLRLETEFAAKGESPLPRMALSTLISSGELGEVIKSIDRLSTKAGAPAIASANMTKGYWPESVQHALHHLRSVFAPLSSQATIGQQAQWVQSAVEDRGILFELKLADVLQRAVPLEATDHGAALSEDKGTSGGPSGSSNAHHVAVEKETGAISDGKGQAAPAMQSNSSGNRFTAGFDSSKSTAIKESFVPSSAGTTPLQSTQTTSPDVARASDSLNNAMPNADQIIYSAQKSLDGSLEKSAAALKALGAAIEIQNQSGTGPVSDSLDSTVLESVRQILSGDLKPQLLILKSFLDQATEHPDMSKEENLKDLSILRQTVHQLLSHVEQQQEHAVRRTVEPDLYQVFTHLLPVKDQSAPVRLKVYYPKKGRAAENDPQHRIALLLDMDQLGLVRADLHMVEQQLRIQFYVQDDTIQQMFAQHAHTVAEVLEGEGHFETVVIDTRVSMEKIQQFEGEDLAGPPLGRIDVSV